MWIIVLFSQGVTVHQGTSLYIDTVNSLQQYIYYTIKATWLCNVLLLFNSRLSCLDTVKAH